VKQPKPAKSGAASQLPDAGVAVAVARKPAPDYVPLSTQPEKRPPLAAVSPVPPQAAQKPFYEAAYEQHKTNPKCLAAVTAWERCPAGKQALQTAALKRGEVPMTADQRRNLVCELGA
jgi:hypothetical protein